MKTITLIFVLLLSGLVNAQIIKDFPVNEKGGIDFTEVIQVDSVSKDELFIRAKTFFVNTFNSGKEVIQMEDKGEGVVIGKGYVGLCDGESGLSAGCYKMQVSIKVSVKDGKYKYNFYDLVFKTEPVYPSFPDGLKYTEGYFFNEDEYYNSSGNPRARNEKTKMRVFKQIIGLKLALKNNMATATKKDDW